MRNIWLINQNWKIRKRKNVFYNFQHLNLGLWQVTSRYLYLSPLFPPFCSLDVTLYLLCISPSSASLPRSIPTNESWLLVTASHCGYLWFCMCLPHAGLAWISCFKSWEVSIGCCCSVLMSLPCCCGLPPVPMEMWTQDQHKKKDQGSDVCLLHKSTEALNYH